MPDSETVVDQFLVSYGLSTERFSKSERKAGKTPDYKVFRERQLQFFCEVKNSKKDRWLDDLLLESEPGENVGGCRNDPVFNRLATHIHKARKQFDAVNPNADLPNVLAFHNAHEQARFLDGLAVTIRKVF